MTTATRPPNHAELSAACLGQRVRRTARAVTRAYNDRLRPLDLNATQFVLLGAVYAEADEPLVQLSARLAVEHSALLRNIKVLTARGLVTGTGGKGRTGRRLRLTDAGRDLLTRAFPVWAETQRALETVLDGTADEVRSQMARLEAAAHAVGEGEG